MNSIHITTGPAVIRHAAMTGLMAMAIASLPAQTGAEPIPALNPKGDVYKTEGPTDHRFYAKATGTLKTVMLFVDFPDVPAGSEKTEPVAAHLLGDGRVQQFFKDQSYGKLELESTLVPGWRRMPKPVGQYVDKHGSFDFNLHKAYLTDACALFPEVNFAAYQIVYVVAAKTDVIRLSPAFNAPPGSGVKTAHGEVRLAVTFGNDSYRNRHTNLIHETGHLLGLPDLYRYGGGLSTGAWDIMCDIFKGTSFLGWHRHKLGWLDPNRETYLKTGTLQTTLTPLSSAAGLSMIVIPADNPAHPTKVFVVEIAEPILGSNGKPWGEGILVYSVDASIATGCDPVVIYPKQPGDSPEYGRLYRAPFGAGDAFQDPNAPMTVKILKQTGRNYEVTVTVKP